MPEESAPVAGANMAFTTGKDPAGTPVPAGFLATDNQAFTIITLNFIDSQIPHIRKCGAVKEMWDALHEVH
jgi:hypothetical protein